MTKAISGLPFFLLAGILLNSEFTLQHTSKENERKSKEEDSVVFVLEYNLPNFSGGYLTVLRDITGTKYLPLYIGAAEGEAISRALSRQRPPRPLTHDLITEIVSQLGGEIQSLIINDLRDNVFYGTLTIKQGKKIHKIDCRPSDGLALALRSSSEIRVNREVINRAGLSSEEMLKKGYPLNKSNKFLEQGI